MYKNTSLRLIGSLLSLSLIIPPSIGKIAILEFSDIPIILLFIYLLFLSFKNFEIKKKEDFAWIFTIFCLILFFIFDGFNTTTLRFVLYVTLGFLFKKVLNKLSDSEISVIFDSLIIVSIFSIAAFLTQQSFLGNSIGWITNYSDTTNIFLSGRLSGFQGSGPNVAGTVFGLLSILFFYTYKTTDKKYYFSFAFINLFLFLLTFSRGSYLAFIFVSIVFIFLKINSTKIQIFYVSGLAAIVMSLLYFGPSSYILKENDRSLLANIAISNIEVFDGVGGGEYINKIYEPYLLSINPEILEENLNIKLNKVELGITPEEYRDTDIDFFIGTSGGGFEILQQYFITKPCSDDRNTCQYFRVDTDTVLNFLQIFDISKNIKLETVLNNCRANSDQNLVTRGEFACLAYELRILSSDFQTFSFEDIDKSNLQNSYFSYLYSNNIFVECEVSKVYACKDRPLAIGELAVITESLFIRNTVLPEENLYKICNECEFRNIKGFIKIEYDKYDYILPRSKISFYTSGDGVNWDLVGFPHYTGEIIEFNKNDGVIEIGGFVDGQSFGNTWLDGSVKSLEIINDDKIRKINFEKNGLDNEYSLYEVNSLRKYNGKVIFDDNGIQLLRPNKYWLAIDNEFNFNEDFEIILEVSLPEIPWETQTLISNTSAFTDDVQSWKVDIDDGRLFLSWTNSDGEYVNQVGDMSLRSGVLVQKNGKLDNDQAPIVSSAFLSQLTTAHNGYLTFFVEYGLLKGLIFFIPLIYLVFKKFNYKKNDSLIILNICLLYFLIHNITNDLIYSPDAMVLFTLLLGLKDSKINQEDLGKL